MTGELPPWAYSLYNKSVALREYSPGGRDNPLQL